MIDISCPADKNVEKKEREKLEKYQELRMELRKLWNKKIDVIPIVIGALGAVTPNFESYLLTLNTKDINSNQLQKTVLLQTANILRRHLDLPGSS